MGVVELDGGVLAKGAHISPLLDVAANEIKQRGSDVKVTLFIPGRHQTTIRDSAQRWLPRLGESEALGPDGKQSSLPMTPELGAEDPNTAAETVYGALMDGRFLALHHQRTGYQTMAVRMREMAGLDPDL